MNEWLVKWKDMPEEEATWESVYLMQQQFPHLHLEDKVHFEKGGIVRTLIVYTYKRKGRVEKRIRLGRKTEKLERTKSVREGGTRELVKRGTLGWEKASEI